MRDRHLAEQPECQFCFRVEGELHVHHIEPVSVRPDRELDPTNLVTLCPHDHLIVGHLGKWSSWNPEIRADLNQWKHKRAMRP